MSGVASVWLLSLGAVDGGWGSAAARPRASPVSPSAPPPAGPPLCAAYGGAVACVTSLQLQPVPRSLLGEGLQPPAFTWVLSLHVP